MSYDTGRKDNTMSNIELKGKKLLILGANPETIPLVEVANDMGIKTIVTSSVLGDAAKNVAWKSFDVDGMDAPGLVELARREEVDGVLVGVADVLVPTYCKVCNALGVPCYASMDIVDIFSYKDRFKATCETYGIHGIPEYYLDEELKREDLDRIEYPVMIKPVDGRSGIGMTVCYEEKDIQRAVKKALAHSRKKRFIVEKYMECDDMGIYYTFKEGECSASCVYDRYTTDEQPGYSRVCLGGTYPSKYIDQYYKRMHKNAVRMFREIGIENGVLMLSAFYKDGEFYVYDTGFRLQGEAPHLLINAINGFDQRQMLIRFALTGSEGDVDLKNQDDSKLRGKYAATVWFLLKEGMIARVEGIDGIDNDPAVIAYLSRLREGETVKKEWIGTEKQVLGRLYLVCDNKEELSEKISFYQEKVCVYDNKGENMLLNGFSVEEACGEK